jgi:hypothetical protein
VPRDIRCCLSCGHVVSRATGFRCYAVSDPVEKGVVQLEARQRHLDELPLDLSDEPLESFLRIAAWLVTAALKDLEHAARETS